MGRRWGKSFLGANVATNILALNGAVAWVSLTYKNSRPLWRQAVRLVSPLPTYFRINESERIITTARGGLLALYSGDNLPAMRGENFDAIILDECAYLKQEEVEEVVYPCLADRDGDLLAISSPKGINWFAEQCDKAALLQNEEAAFWRAPTSANPMPTIQKAYKLAKERLPDAVFAQEWDALFVTPGGTVFQNVWFTERTTAHQVSERYISWDTALKDKEQNDLSAYSVGEISPDYRLHLVEGWKEHLAFPDLPGEIQRGAERWNFDGKLKGVIIEDKGSGTSAIQVLRASAPEWLRDKIFEFQPQGDKVARANEAAIWCKLGCVLLPPIGPSWLFDFERNLFAFPAVLHDDDIDAFTQLILYLKYYLSYGFDTRNEKH